MLALDRAKIAVNTGVSIARIEREGVVLLLESGAERLAPADSIILAGEVEPDTTLFDQLQASFSDPEGSAVELHAVGDCTGLGLIRKAALEGARAATAL